MEEEYEMLRSLYQVCLREGADTNWDALTRRLRGVLLKRAGLPDDACDNDVAIATCTPLTFRIPKMTGGNL